MLRLLTALVMAALLISAVPLTSAPTASAQATAVTVCLTLAPGEHTFAAPARDRDGEVTFTVTVEQGGLVTNFVEPGGRTVPPAAMLDIFGGEDPYPLPDGIAIVDCAEAAAESPLGAMASDEICTNLDAGSYTETVSAGGRTYDIIISVDDRHVIESIDIRGQAYTATEALDLLAGFGASVPEGMEVFPCAFPPDSPSDSMSDDYPTSGSGGLADSSTSSSWFAISAILLATVLAATTAFTAHRRIDVRARD